MDPDHQLSRGETFDSNEVALVRHNRWFLALAASPLLLSLAAVVAAITVSPEFIAVVFHPIVVAAIALVYTWNRNPRSLSLPTRVRADRRGVSIEGRPLLPRAEIREGFVLPRPGKPPIVRLVRKGLRPAVEIEVGNENEGRRLLRALGLDASQTVAKFRVSSRALAHRPWMFGVAGAMVAVGFLSRLAVGTHANLLPVVFPVVIGLVLALALVPSSLRVGVDGVLLSWLGRKRFVSYADVDAVTEYTTGFGRSRVFGVVLTLAGGERIEVPVSSTRWDGGRVGIILERIREAMDTYERGGIEADAALLRRGDRQARDWITALRAIGTGANAAHRTAPVAPEQLWRIVEDPGGEPVARAAAAIALGAVLDDEGRSRLRIAAEATAAPKLRVALEAAADEREEEALSAALVELEEQPPERAASG